MFRRWPDKLSANASGWIRAHSFPPRYSCACRQLNCSFQTTTGEAHRMNAISIFFRCLFTFIFFWWFFVPRLLLLPSAPMFRCSQMEMNDFAVTRTKSSSFPSRRPFARPLLSLAATLRACAWFDFFPSNFQFVFPLNLDDYARYCCYFFCFFLYNRASKWTREGSLSKCCTFECFVIQFVSLSACVLFLYFSFRRLNKTTIECITACAGTQKRLIDALWFITPILEQVVLHFSVYITSHFLLSSSPFRSPLFVIVFCRCFFSFSAFI